MKNLFSDYKLEINDTNFLNLLASQVCKKHGVDILTVNNALSECYLYYDCKLINTDLLHVYDQFMSDGSREETGSYYTPLLLAEKMVRMSFYDYYKDKNIEELDFFYKPYNRSCQQLVESLKQLKIADIACGSGVFLVASIKILKEYYNALGETIEITHIVNQMFGMDIQETPLKILKILLFDIQLEESEVKPEFNLYHLDTLLEFNESIEFDIIIGNPPYVGEKGNKTLFDHYKHLEGYEGRMDLFYFFIYKGYKHLKADGVLLFITTNYFITADGAAKLRQFLKTKSSFRRIVNLDECKLFSEAKGMHNLIYSFGKEDIEQVDIRIISKSKVKDLDNLLTCDYKISQGDLFSETGNMILYEDQSYYTVIKKMLDKSIQTLGQLVTINQGIVSGADKVTKSIIKKKLSQETLVKYKIEEGDPIYVFEHKPFESDYFKPFYKNSQIKPYLLDEMKSKWILYVNNGDIEESNQLYHHFLPFRELLSLRREVKTGKRDWYALQWGRMQSIFDSEKIVVPQRATKNIFGYTDKPFYSSADVYYLTNGPLKFLLGLLNSKIYYFWLYNRGKRKGKSLELYAKPLSQIPVPMMPYHIIEDMVEDVIYHQGDTNQLDQYLYKFYELTDKEIADVELLYNRG